MRTKSPKTHSTEKEKDCAFFSRKYKFSITYPEPSYRNILASFIPDISKKKMESYKADAEYIVEWVKSGKNLIVYI